MNAQAKHAPGPWTYSPPKRGEKRKVRAFGGAYIVAADVAGEANACLIAAAPEMAEALARIASGSITDCGPNSLGTVNLDKQAMQAIARAALRKAGLLS